jgi:hypothetical protein
MICAALSIQRVSSVPVSVNTFTEENVQTQLQFSSLSYNQVLTQAHLDDLQMKLDVRTLRFAGHVARMGPERNPNRFLFNDFTRAVSQKRGSTSYTKVVQSAADRVNMPGVWKNAAQNREVWADNIDDYRKKSIDKRKRRPIRHLHPHHTTPSSPIGDIAQLYSDSEGEEMA